MKLTWYGHSCFKMETQGGSLVLDPYAAGSVPGLTLPPLTADAVLCSHGHADHSAAEAVKLTGRSPDFTAERLCAWHDDVRGAKRGDTALTVVVWDGFRVAHLGDLGCALTAEQLRILRGVDALLLPVGGYYTIDAPAAQAMADEIGAAVTIPMHYRGEGFGYGEIATVDEFAALSENVVYAQGSSVELRRFDGTKKTVILKPEQP